MSCCLRYSPDGLRVRQDGRMEMYCSAHVKPILYCLCRKPFVEHAPESEAMIQCDNCQEWYHFSCVGITKQNKNTDQTQTAYQCSSCKDKDETFLKEKQHLAYKKDMQLQRNEKTLAALDILLQRSILATV